MCSLQSKNRMDTKCLEEDIIYCKISLNDKYTQCESCWTLNQIINTDKSFSLTRDSWSIDIELVIDFVS